MTAAIVLHGLFLLVCNSASTPPIPPPGYCYIYVPHTPMPDKPGDVHDYYVGTVDGADQLTLTSLPEQGNKTLIMSMGLELAAPRKDPFQRKYADGGKYSDHQFMLNGALNPDPKLARNIIMVPWPDEIVGGNRVSAMSSDVVNGTDGSYISSNKDIAGQYLFSETVVLYYYKGASFTLRDESNAVKLISANAGATSIMVLESWPPAGADAGDHSSGLDNMLSDPKDSSYHAGFHVTGIAKVVESGSEDEFCQLGLPPSVVKTPTAATATLMVQDKNGQSRPNQGHMHILTGTQTGCGVISNGR